MKKLLLYAIGLTSFCLAAIISVPDDYETIQEAVDFAVDGDWVVLSPGNYNENVIVSGKDLIIGSEYLTTGNEMYILNTRIMGYSDVAASVTFQDDISSEAGLIGLTVSQLLVYGGC